MFIVEHGGPVAFYSDKHTVFRGAKLDAMHGNGMTQCGRALAELNVEILYANSSQAKGRVGRANRTLQDRLVKELQLEGIATLEDGNGFVPGFIKRLNGRFAVPPARPDDLQLQISWQRKLLILERNALTKTLPGRYVELFDCGGGRLEIRWNGVALPYLAFDAQRSTRTTGLRTPQLSRISG